MGALAQLPGNVRSFFENTIVLSTLLSWAMAQFIKALIALLHVRRRGVKEVFIALFWKTGGMPSSHAALVCAMTTAVGFRDGAASDLFAVCLFVSLVVIRDALGVRRSTGLQARSLNTVGRLVAERLGADFHPVKEVMGHTPIEVVAGSFLGVFIAGAICFL